MRISYSSQIKTKLKGQEVYYILCSGFREPKIVCQPVDGKLYSNVDNVGLIGGGGKVFSCNTT